MSLNSVLAMLVGVILFNAPAHSAASIKWSNTGKWRVYCKESDFDRPEIQPLIERLKRTPLNRVDFRTPENMELIARIAAFGKDAIPYALRLKEDRAFFMTYPAQYFNKHLTVERPYVWKADWIIAAVRDPRALPLLSRLVTDPEIGRSALDAFETIASSAAFSENPSDTQEVSLRLSSNTLRAMIYSNSQIWMHPDRVPTLSLRYMRLLAAMPRSEAIGIIRDVIRDNPISQPYLDPRSIGTTLISSDHQYVDLHGYTESDVERLNPVLAAIAELDSPGAFIILYKQTYGLTNAIGYYERNGSFQHEHFTFYETDYKANGERKAKMLALSKKLLAGYEAALSKISRSLNVDHIVLPDKDWIWGPKPEARSQPWGLSFRVFSFFPQVKITIKRGAFDRSPLVDAENVTWLERSLELKASDVFPYREDFLIRCSPNKKFNLYEFAVYVRVPPREYPREGFPLSAFPPSYFGSATRP